MRCCLLVEDSSLVVECVCPGALVGHDFVADVECKGSEECRLDVPRKCKFY